MNADIFQGGLEILEELPSLSPGERRFTVRWPAAEDGRALMIHTTHGEPVPQDLLAQRRDLAARLRKKLSPHMASVLEWRLTADEDYFLADHLGNMALRDILRRRRKLRVDEIFPLLHQIHTAVSLAVEASWPRLSLDARALLVKVADVKSEVPQDLASVQIKFPPPSLPALFSNLIEFQATMTMDPVAMESDMAASVPLSSAIYIQSAAELCCELLGQPRRAGTISYQPIPDLGPDENEVLRAVLTSPLGSPPYESLADFLIDLTQQEPPQPTCYDSAAEPAAEPAADEEVRAAAESEAAQEAEPAAEADSDSNAEEDGPALNPAEFAATPMRLMPRGRVPDPQPVDDPSSEPLPQFKAPSTLSESFGLRPSSKEVSPVAAPLPEPAPPRRIGEAPRFDLRVSAPGASGLLIRPLEAPTTAAGDDDAQAKAAPAVESPVSAPAPAEVDGGGHVSGSDAGKLAAVSPEARAGMEARPKPARIQIKPRETARLPTPSTIPANGTLLLGEGIMLPPLGQVFDRLRLMPERESHPILGLSARKEIVMGRSPHDNDYVAQFRPRSPMNDSRTLKISRAQLKLNWGRGDILEVKDTGSQNSSRIGENPITSMVELTGSNRVVLAGEYALRISRFATAFGSQPRVIRLSPDGEQLPDETLMGGGVGIEPLERMVLPFRLVWLQSDVSFAIDEKSNLYFTPPTAPGCQGRFHYYGGCFWLEVVKPELGFWVEMTKLAPGQVAPLTPGMQLQIAGVTYRVAAEGAE